MKNLSNLLIRIGAIMVGIVVIKAVIGIVLKVLFSILGIVFSSGFTFILTGIILFAIGMLLRNGKNIKISKEKK